MLNLIIEYYSGILGWADIQELKKKEYSDLEYDSSFYLIGDIRDSIVRFKSENEIDEFVKYVENEKIALSSKKVAILTRSPKNVVNSTLIIKFSENLPMSFKTFSSFNSMVFWLEVDSDKV